MSLGRMNIFIKIKLCLFSILMLCSCTFTDMTGYVDPAYKNYKLGKVLVYIDGAMLGEMLEAEDDIIEQLKKYGISSIKYSSIVPPTRDTPELRMQHILKSGCNSLFAVSIQKDSNQEYVPATYIYGKYGTKVSNGYYSTEPILISNISIVNLNTGDIVYRADGVSDGGLSYLQMIVHATKKALRDMEKQGLIQSMPQDK